MIQDIWKLANLETHILRLLASVGLTSNGLAYLKTIRISKNNLITDITLTVLCARSSDTEVTMEVNLRPSPPKPSSPKPSSEISSQSIFAPFHPTSGGMVGLTLSLEQLEALQRSL